MNKDITYKIQFYSQWHCGSGQAAGADMDLLVIKDGKKLPYIPGRTMKGLIKDAATTLGMEGTTLKAIFGEEGKSQGCAYFTNAVLGNATAKAIKDEDAQFLYDKVAATAIEDNGLAKDGSLRKMQVTVPCALYGRVNNVPAENVNEIGNALRMIKRLGTGRNHGYGRCDIKTIKEEDAK